MTDRVQRYETILADELAVELSAYMEEVFDIEVSSIKDPITEETLVMRVDGLDLDEEQSDAVLSFLSGWFRALQSVTRAYKIENGRESE